MDIRLERSHLETNEDGRTLQHPGYITRECMKCGKPFICAVTSVVQVCGDPDDDKVAA